MLYRTCNTCFPILAVGAIVLFGAIGKCQFQYTTEGTLLTNHTFVIAWSDNLISPPARCDLSREHILVTSLLLESLGDIVSKRTLGFGVVCKSGLQDFVAYRLSVQVKFKHT